MDGRRRHESGFTLIELMTTLAIAAVVLGLGLPALNDAMTRARTANAYHALTAAMSSARMAAISRRAAVTVCPSADGRHCRPDLVWEDGWIVFDDPARTGAPQGDAAVIRHQGAIGAGVTIRSTSGRHRVRFLPNGMSSGSNLSLWMCSTADRRLLGRIAISNTGRARSERETGTVKPCPHGP